MRDEKQHIEYFSSGDGGMTAKIIFCAILFHVVVAGVCFALHYVNLKPEPEQIPVFEMVQVSQPKPVTPKPPEPIKPPEPQKPKPEVKPKPEPKPKVNKQLPPEPKIEENKPEPEPEEVKEDPTPELEPTPEPEPKDDFDVDDMELPSKLESPSLNPVGSVDMDPLMQVYLDQLKKIIMANFNPPSQLSVNKKVKTTVQFTVDRMGGISAIMLKRSSGNQTWDHLSVRAVKISRVPPLPPNFRAPSLILHFNFTPN